MDIKWFVIGFVGTMLSIAIVDVFDNMREARMYEACVKYHSPKECND